MKKYLPIIIASISFIFPLCYCGYCIINSRLIASAFLMQPLIAVAAAVLFTLIKRIPTALKFSGASLVFIFSFGLFFVSMTIGEPTEFVVKDGESVIAETDSELIGSAGGYESARGYKFIWDAPHTSAGEIEILKFDEDGFLEAVKYIEENYEFYVGSVGEYYIAKELELDGFNFRVDGDSNLPYAAKLTGINYDTREIAFASYFWTSGSISEIDEDFISYSCGWRYVKPYEKGGLPALYWYCLTD